MRAKIVQTGPDKRLQMWTKEYKQSTARPGKWRVLVPRLVPSAQEPASPHPRTTLPKTPDAAAALAEGAHTEGQQENGPTSLAGVYATEPRPVLVEHGFGLTKVQQS